MNKRFTFTRVLSLLVILLTVFTLFGCEPEVENTDQATVDTALANVALTYGTGDTALTVTQNLTLPTTVGTVTITWASGNTAVISNAGVVTRQASDTNVTLTATLTLGEATATKQFTLKVLAAPVVIDVAEAVAAIQVFFETGDTASAVTQDLILPVASRTLVITWTTTNAAVINAYGNVTRPAYGTSNETVIVTATIGDESKEFVITVLAVTVKPVSLLLEEARLGLLLAGTGSGVAANLTLPATAGSEGVTVTWTSDTPESISNTGVVVRQPENVTVILTATLRYPNSTLTATKTFEVVVLAFAPFTEVDTIAEALLLDELSYAKVPEVTVVALTTDGYMIYDGATLLFVYTGGAPAANVVVGTVFTITGMVDFYNGSMQFNGTADANKPTILVELEDATPAVLTPTVITTSVSDYIATLPAYNATTPAYTIASPLVYRYITISGKIRVQPTSDGNYNTFIVNTGYTGTDINSAANSDYTTNAFMIYYKSNKAAVEAYDGLDVTLNVFIYALRTDRTIYTVIYTGTIDEVQTSLNDAGIVAVVKGSLATKFVNAYEAAATLSLPTLYLGTTIVWDTASELLNVATGALTLPATGQVDVTVNATLTRNAATDTFTVTFKVGELPVLTIAEAIATAVGNRVRTVGIVTSSEYQNTYFIQDATGGIAIYTATAALEALLQGALGKEVEVFGSRAVYSNMRQITPTVINVRETAVMPTPANVDAVALNAVDMLPYQGQLISMTQLYATAVATDSYGNITVTFEKLSQAKTIVMKWDSRVALSTEAAALLAGVAVGDLFNITNPLAWNNNPYLYFTSSTVLTDATLNDLSKAALDAKALTFAATYIQATTLTFAATGTNGSTIAWVSDNALINVTTGAVTMPTEGPVLVTLTATLTLGTSEFVKVITTTVGVEPVVPQSIDLYFSEYIEGGSNNKALEIYNPTNASVNLSNYSIELYSNGGTTSPVIQVLTGTLAAGDVVVIVNPQAVASMLALADIVAPTYPNVVSFNGDDAVILKNGTTIIDSIGQFGVDPGTQWGTATVNSTLDMTLVRIASIKMGRIDTAAAYDVTTQWVAFPINTETHLGKHFPDLFISEYIEGGSNNKAIEIYNPTVQTIDLSTYKVNLYSNGLAITAVPTQTLTLTGTLAPGAVIIIVNAGATAEFKVGTYVESTITYYNGDDALVLLNGTNIIDSIGQVGTDPGTLWGTAGVVSTLDMTLVRKPTVTRGRTDATSAFDPSIEWVAYPNNTATYLNAHTMS
jgi:predicted extracellular nuclease